MSREIERLLSERRNVDYASGRTCFQERQEQVGEQEAGKIVHCEAQFVAVGAGLPCPLRATAANPGVVDEEIEALRRALHRVGQAPHFGKSGNVGLQKFGGTRARVDCCNDLLAASANRGHALEHDSHLDQAFPRPCGRRRPSSR